MAQQIKWTPLALEDYCNAILYLERSWSQKIADDFAATTETKLETPAQQPLDRLAVYKRARGAKYFADETQ